MTARLLKFIRDRWHPLWRLRQIFTFRWLQQKFDFTVYTRIPETGLRVAVKCLRDASWMIGSTNHEPEIRAAFALVLERLRPSVFWDVGANIGFYSWFVRQHPAVKQVVMFEPDPTNFALITKTIRQNSLPDCRPVQVALADEAGETRFLLDRASWATGALAAVARPEDGYSLHHAYQLKETMTCQTATIDGLIGDGFAPPMLVKIDVEGAEHLVLAGAEMSLRKFHPTLIVETANADLIRHVRGLGYRAFQIDGGNVLFIAEAANLDFGSIAERFPERADSLPCGPGA